MFSRVRTCARARPRRRVHPGRSRPRPALVTTPVLAETLCRDSVAGGQCGRQLVSRVELEFAEDAREVALNGASGDEEGLCDLAVGEVVAGELGDAAFAGCQ